MSRAAIDRVEKKQETTNFDLLKKYLKEKSLARLIVDIYCNPGDLSPQEAMTIFIQSLVKEEKSKYERAED